MGLPFRTGPGALIPRQDTETLAEWVLEDDRKKAAAPAGSEDREDGGNGPAAGRRLLDLCTGTGCIGLSLARLGGYQVTLTDLSEEALCIAGENREALGVEARIYAGDLFDALPVGERYDVIVSNPPYIESAVIETLQEEVRLYEPRMALDGRADGLYFYRQLLRGAPSRMKPGGRMYVEIGCDQGAAVSRLFEEAGFTEVSVRRDLAGKDRVVRGAYPDV